MKQEWEIYSEIDEKGRFPKKIKKEHEEENKKITEEYEDMYWKEQERECIEHNEKVLHMSGEYDCDKLEYY